MYKSVMVFILNTLSITFMAFTIVDISNLAAQTNDIAWAILIQTVLLELKKD